MGVISEQDKKVITEMFESLKHNVTLVFFTEGKDGGKCLYCRETKEILEDIVSLSEKIQLKAYEFAAQKEKAHSLGIDKIPAFTILGENEKDYGIRFYGVPSGYEFGTLIEDIVMVSKQKTELSENTKTKIKAISKETHIQVFVTPT